MSLAALSSLPGRVFAGRVWRQCSPRRGLLEVAHPAATTGRYHRLGGPGVWYASSTRAAAWAEFFRHLPSGGVSPSEIRRRVGRARVARLRALDLTDARIRRALGITVRELTGDDLARCQALADAARAAGFEGIVPPSAARAGASTVVVFAPALAERVIADGPSIIGHTPQRRRRANRR